MGSTLETLRAIEKLKELRTDWDSYGAGEIVLSAREDAKRFIEFVEQTMGARYANPLVGPTPDGGVSLIWPKRGRGEVEAMFSPSGRRRYIVIEHQKVVAEGEIGQDTTFIAQYVQPS